MLLLIQQPVVHAAKLDAEDKARLKRVVKLAKTGSSQLAQQLVDAYQPPEQWIDSWVLWERQRFVILKNRGDWQGMIRRTRELPENVSPMFRQWVLEQAADASLRLADAGQARVYLRKLLLTKPLTGSEKLHKKNVARWRRMVIRSYLRDGRVVDANLALTQYIEDYNPHNTAWSVLQARVQMMSGEYSKAFETLSGIDRYESKLLQQLAALRGKLIAADKVITKTGKLQKRLKKDSRLHLQSSILLAEAAVSANKDWLRVNALEDVLQVTSGHSFEDEVYQQVSGDTLLKAYLATAERWGNNRRLLVGDDKAWLKAAKKAEKRKKKLLARSIYALVLQTGTDENKTGALQSLIELLIIDDKDKVIYALFNGKLYKDVSVLPAKARFKLAEYALQRRFINMAGRMIEGLNQSPKDDGKQLVPWPARQARILVYSGKHDAGIKTLQDYISSKKSFTVEQAEKTAQVIFDLQAVERHQDAIKLLQLLRPRVKDNNAQRDLFFWMADSWKALKEYSRAAELYLRAAYHGQPRGGDFMGQTARFHAAEALAKGGMTDDARFIYGSLLRGTQDARRRSMLKQRIEELWLYQKEQSDIPFLLTPR